MSNQIRTALANLVIVLVLGGAWILADIRVKPQHLILGNVLVIASVIALLGLLEHGCLAWYRIWRVKA